MHLAQGRRRQGFWFERGKRLGEPYTELGLHDFFHFAEREGLDPILQPRQRLEVRERKQVGAGRKKLAQLDVRRAQPLQVIRQLGGAEGSASSLVSASVIAASSPALRTRSERPYLNMRRAISAYRFMCWGRIDIPMGRRGYNSGGRAVIQVTDASGAGG